jgi:hypothetical protein
MQLQPEQILIAAALGTAIVWVLTVVVMGLFKQPKPSEDVLKTLAFIASTGLAYWWMPIELPAIGDGIFPFITALLVSATAIFKFAQEIYDHVWQPFTNFVAKKVKFLSFVSVKRS